MMMADIHGRFVRTLVPSQGRGYAVGVAYNWRSDLVFWSDTNTQKVSVVHCWMRFSAIAFFLLSLVLLFIVEQSFSDWELGGQNVVRMHFSSASSPQPL